MDIVTTVAPPPRPLARFIRPSLVVGALSLLAVVALSDVRDIDEWQAVVEVPPQSFEDTPLSASLKLQTTQGALRVHGQAAVGDVRIAAIDGAATLGDEAIDIAPSTLELATPQGRVAVQGRIPFDATAALALTLQTEGLSVAAEAAPALQIAGRVQLGGRPDALILAPDVSLRREGWPQARATGRIAQRDGAWWAEALQLKARDSLLALDGALTPTADATPLRLRLQQFDPALLLPDWPGNIDADLVWTGAYGDPGLDGELRIERLQGELRSRALQGEGIIVLAEKLGVQIVDDPATQLEGAPAGYHQKTLVAQLAQAVFGSFHLGFILITVVTALILVLAANTAFNGFPVLGSILAQDSYLPRQLHTRGDRLAFSNGIAFLSLSALLAIWAQLGLQRAA